ncbi:unnamed protein product [Discula destructiva]
MTALLRQSLPSSAMNKMRLDSVVLNKETTRNDELSAATLRHVQFMDLPTEIHTLISKELIYPDALSLKHTSRYFYSLVDTGVRLKVAWLMSRRLLHLDCPKDRKCILKTDLEFCRGSVTLLMQRRREHMECESRPGLGCLVYDTPQCAFRRDWRRTWRRRLRRQVTIELWWVLLAVIPLLLGWLWMAELAGWFLS